MVFGAVGVLVVGQEPGDGAQAGVEGFAAAVVAAEDSPVLEVSDGVLDPDARGGVPFAGGIVSGDDARW